MNRKIQVIIGGTEHNPQSGVDIQLMRRVSDENADKMNELFQKYFGLDPHNRYMGNFPYPDRDTGACCVAEYIHMESHAMRDAIVASLEAAIQEAGLSDITVKKEDGECKPWPAQMGIVAMGSSIINNLVAEQRIQAALVALEGWLRRRQATTR